MPSCYAKRSTSPCLFESSPRGLPLRLANSRDGISPKTRWYDAAMASRRSLFLRAISHLWNHQAAQSRCNHSPASIILRHSSGVHCTTHWSKRIWSSAWRATSPSLDSARTCRITPVYCDQEYVLALGAAEDALMSGLLASLASLANCRCDPSGTSPVALVFAPSN